MADGLGRASVKPRERALRGLSRKLPRDCGPPPPATTTKLRKPLSGLGSRSTVSKSAEGAFCRRPPPPDTHTQ